MPGRRDVFVNNNIYHVFNRTLDGKKIFDTTALASLFLDTIYYYRSTLTDRSYSHFRLLDTATQESLKKRFAFQKYFYIDILGYCLMPTHFHLLVQQRKERGVQIVMSNLINSFTRYYNMSVHRKGPIFLPRFQSREIITDDVLVHVSRYQHLNPYAGGLVHTFEELAQYPWSSYKVYHNGLKSDLVTTTLIMSLFGNDTEKYRTFVENQADYQRSLENLKYLEKW